MLLICFHVISPAYDRTTYGPYDPVADYRLVFAATARRAKVLAVRSWRRESARRRNWVTECDGNPFVGLRAERDEDPRAFVRRVARTNPTLSMRVAKARGSTT